MKIIKTLVLAVSMTCTLASCAQWGNGKKIKGNGDIATVTRSVGDYDGVKAAGSMDVNLVRGSEGSITLEGDSNLLEYIETEVSKNNLVIKIKKGFNLKPTKSLIITVPYEDIELVALAGSGDINSQGTLSSDKLEVALAGSGDINLDISSTNVVAKIAGSGDINLSGNAEDLDVRLAGSGDFHGKDLKSKDVDAAISGSGTIKVHCSGDLKGRISGSGDIIYSGNPKSKDTKVSGSGRIKS